MVPDVMETIQEPAKHGTGQGTNNERLKTPNTDHGSGGPLEHRYVREALGPRDMKCTGLREGPTGQVQGLHRVAWAHFCTAGPISSGYRIIKTNRGAEVIIQ